jgi:hypothetical protein
MLTELILLFLTGPTLLWLVLLLPTMADGSTIAKEVLLPSMAASRLYKSFQIWDVEVAVSPPQMVHQQAAAVKAIAAQAGVIE